MRSKVFNKRLVIIFIFFLLSICFLFSRCFYLQVLKFDKFSKLADNQHSTTVILEPGRGEIYDSNRNVLAASLSAESVYGEPHRIKDFTETVKSLAGALNLKEKFIAERLKQPRFFVWIKRKTSKEEAAKLKEYNLKGIGFIKESKRFYSMNNLASHVLGFANIDNTGLEGVELYYDDYLRGTKGYKRIIRDAHLRELSAFSELYMPAIDGYDLILTIDSVIQNISETALKEGMLKFNAKAAMCVVMNPNTGEIYALVNLPDFNANSYAGYSHNILRNKVVCDMFEPGSVFKIVIASAALEEGLVKPEDLFYCENGTYKIGSRTLHDHRPHKWLTFKQIIADSSNIGTVKVAQSLGDKILYKYIKLYGFGSPTGIDLPGEAGGFVRPPSEWSKLSIAAVPIGHEVGVNVLQLTAAISVIANGGFLVKPFVVKRIENNNGEIIKAYNPSAKKKRIISEKTAFSMKEILTAAVKEGTGKEAALKNYEVAGKTGTAQKIEADGSYSHSKYMASFVGFAPVDNPKIAVCVVYDEPASVYYGGLTAAPAFAAIADATLNYLKVK